ncbi:MAG: response regulator [Lachnospiraceae bacterium]|nr:response regulator [Lachnospiraceae bacterium]
MNLLIVDDERLTREGVLHSIDFQSLGVDHIETAEDGLNALTLCANFRPDIVLTDVRMPKMDGIRMMEQIQEWDPDCAVIFMSGFSDKEYLKAAIKLHAVSYVEKPIDTKELTEALIEALKQVKSLRSLKDGRDASRLHTEFALAYRLIHARETGENRGITEEDFSFPVKDYPWCFSVLIRCYDPGFMITEEGALILAEYLSPLLQALQLKRLYTVNAPLFVFHFFGRKELSEGQLHHLGNRLAETLQAKFQSFHAVIGRQVKGFSSLAHSYSTAVINLQQCFFHEDNICLLYRHIPGRTEFKSLEQTEWFRNFRKLLSDHKEAETIEYLNDILDTLKKEDYILPNQAREFYYRLFQIVRETGSEQKLDQDRYLPGSNLWEKISACHSVFELHQMLSDSIRLFFEGSKSVSTESPVVYAIKTYISEHYKDVNLSIMAISTEVHLSGSYVCTLFKSETGITLNQYITEYRLSRACELLKDPRNRIAEIAGQVGYSDSNYFSKIFRKSYGFSPSEYRERI